LHCDGRIQRIAAGVEDGAAGLGRQRMRCHHHVFVRNGELFGDAPAGGLGGRRSGLGRSARRGEQQAGKQQAGKQRTGEELGKLHFRFSLS
jgi:hypothetical protein